MATDPPIEPRRIQHFRIALSRNTVELPWTSRRALLERVNKHDAGLQVRLVTVDGLPPGVWELRNELQNELADGELDAA